MAVEILDLLCRTYGTTGTLARWKTGSQYPGKATSEQQESGDYYLLSDKDGSYSIRSVFFTIIGCETYSDTINVQIKKNTVLFDLFSGVYVKGAESGTGYIYELEFDQQYQIGSYTDIFYISVEGLFGEYVVCPVVADRFRIKINGEYGEIKELYRGAISQTDVMSATATAAVVEYGSWCDLHDEWEQLSLLKKSVWFDNRYSYESEFHREYQSEPDDDEVNLIVTPDIVYVSPDFASDYMYSVKILDIQEDQTVTEDEKVAIEGQLALIYSALLTLAQDDTLQVIAGHTEILSDDPLTCEQMSANTSLIVSAAASLQGEISLLKDSLDAIGEQVEFHTSELIGIHSAGDSLLVSMASQLTEFQNINNEISRTADSQEDIRDKLSVDGVNSSGGIAEQVVSVVVTLSSIRSSIVTLSAPLQSIHEDLIYNMPAISLGVVSGMQRLDINLSEISDKISQDGDVLNDSVLSLNTGISTIADTRFPDVVAGINGIVSSIDTLNLQFETIDDPQRISDVLKGLGLSVQQIEEMFAEGKLTPIVEIDNQIGDCQELPDDLKRNNIIPE